MLREGLMLETAKANKRQQEHLDSAKSSVGDERSRPFGRIAVLCEGEEN